ncbi:NATT3 protein, partial [Ptilonorhynchus violaceus]|nr:NATT3 protein [Ptilonorhynchus violaceus]
EYVCSTQPRRCNLGSFDPERGPFCFFLVSEKELKSPEFQILVNPGGFEALDWVNTSFGSIPEGAVEGCPLRDVFVGRSRDGLGMVDKEQQALFVARDGEEIWYKWYQVLVVRQGPSDVSISNVSYDGSAALERSEDTAL